MKNNQQEESKTLHQYSTKITLGITSRNLLDIERQILHGSTYMRYFEETDS